MKCYYHNDKDGVAQCQECGIFLCKECSDKFTYDGKIICEKCASKINNLIKDSNGKIKIKLLGILIFWLLLGVIVIFGLQNTGFESFVIFSLLGFIFYCRKDIPIPKMFLMGGFWFWIIIFFLYISWGMLYIFIIYPIKNFRILLNK